MMLSYVPQQVFDHVKDLPAIPRARAFAALNRINSLYMIKHAGSGHIGSSFSAIDIMTWILQEYPDDIFFSSKGHDCPALYATMISMGKLPWDMLHKLRRKDGLPGHPTVQAGFPASTGSLGMGISKAKGIAWAKRFRGESGQVFVMVGDGELQEGQNSEAFMSLRHGPDSTLPVRIILDMNGYQSDCRVSLSPMLSFSAFCPNGHDFVEIEKALQSKEQIIRALTVKGKGVAFMEAPPWGSSRETIYAYHSGAPNDSDYVRALEELGENAAKIIHPVSLNLVEIEVETREKQPNPLIVAYGRLLCEAAAKDERILALDADLMTDHCLTEFRKAFPRRFIECGIAEQDMVSMAGALARQGFIPFVHSFAAFLVRRAYDQIYNNCCEGDKIIYVGSMAGPLRPDGPGESHEILHDATLMNLLPGMMTYHVTTPTILRLTFQDAIERDQPSYLRFLANA